MSIDLIGLKTAGRTPYQILMWTPHFVVLKTDAGVEVTVRKDGRMIVRKASNEEAAKQVAVEVMRAVTKRQPL